LKKKRTEYYIGLKNIGDTEKRFEEDDLRTGEYELRDKLYDANSDTYVSDKKYILIQDIYDPNNEDVKMLLKISYDNTDKINNVTVKMYDTKSNEQNQSGMTPNEEFDELEKYHLIERLYKYKIITYVESTNKIDREKQKDIKYQEYIKQQQDNNRRIVNGTADYSNVPREDIAPTIDIESLKENEKKILIENGLIEAGGRKRRGSKRLKRKNRKTTRSRRNA